MFISQADNDKMRAANESNTPKMNIIVILVNFVTWDCSSPSVVLHF